MKILITGGAGFAGSNIAVDLKRYFQGSSVTALDNLYREGSKLNLPRLKKNGIKFIKGDVRKPKDLEKAGETDFLIECSAEPSVLAGSGGDTSYLIETNLNGAINCADFCVKNNAGMIFLSTSRVYPAEPLIKAKIKEEASRFSFASGQTVKGLSVKGVSENFPLPGKRSLYGATKLSSEMILEEYRDIFNIPIIINRCGVIAGPWQFGKSDQGIAAFWTASHLFKKKLNYIGFGGKGKQLRDFLHIDDLTKLLITQLKSPEKFSKDSPFNIGGGKKTSASLMELTEICAEITGTRLKIGSIPDTRYADIPVYITDTSKIQKLCKWHPEKDVTTIIKDIYTWLKETPKTEKLFN